MKMKTRDVCALLGVTQNTLRIWCEKGEGPPYIRVGRGHYIFEEADVKTWLARIYTGDKQDMR